MKKQTKFCVSLMLLLASMAGVTSCKKTAPNIFNMFDVTLELHSNSVYSLSENQTLNEGDSIYFDFTIKSPTQEMYQVALFQIGSALPNFRINLDEANRHTYTGVIKGVVGANGAITTAMIPGSNGGSIGNLKDGANTFRIWAYDKQGVYLGDGYKTITVNVNNKITHIVNRKIYFPDVDSANGSANAYISLATGETFNYQTGAANSAKIDLGIYRVGGTISGNVSLRFYALTASPLPFTPFNISSWTKRDTKISNPQTGQNSNFLRSYYTAASMLAYINGASARRPTLTATSSNVAVNSVISFLTPEGKYGLLLVNQISPNGDKPFVDVSIKYEL